MEVVKPKIAFQAIVGEGKGSILYGGEEMPNGYYGDHKAGEQIALKAVADSGYEFVGWYTYGEGSEFIPENLYPIPPSIPSLQVMHRKQSVRYSGKLSLL